MPEYTAATHAQGIVNPLHSFYQAVTPCTLFVESFSSSQLRYSSITTADGLEQSWLSHHAPSTVT